MVLLQHSGASSAYPSSSVWHAETGAEQQPWGITSVLSFPLCGCVFLNKGCEGERDLFLLVFQFSYFTLCTLLAAQAKRCVSHMVVADRYHGAVRPPFSLGCLFTVKNILIETTEIERAEDGQSEHAVMSCVQTAGKHMCMCVGVHVLTWINQGECWLWEPLSLPGWALSWGQEDQQECVVEPSCAIT